MKIVTRLSFCVVLLLGSWGVFAQQRPVISQYMYNGMVLNPAYAGSTNEFSAAVIHRDQWVNIDGAPSFQTFTGHTPLFSNQIGVGLTATRDQVGIHTDYGFYASYAYKIKLATGYLAMGLQGGFNDRRSNYDLLTIRDENDNILSGVDRKFSPNFGTGAYYYNKRVYLGASIPHIVKNRVVDVSLGKETEARTPRYVYLTGGIVFPLTDNINLLPAVLIRYQDHLPLGIDLNCNVIFEDIVYAGLSYRSGDSMTLITQLVLNENIRLGYAYDMVTSNQRQYTNGTHEIMINYRVLIKALSKDPLCPVYY
ncbi:MULTISPECIES: type IX secretion system membrane protein PorP/SprF [unclassified Imperialibacter]|uniref:PorP/SprF family type IX secretion system membrane protein n=1 Tax=unclassified Imperialibacter TaxID=2629706 RepID=UPI001251087A|nr:MULTISPECIES: type IX secretion system membrane protein PorP/SprF [unclassified Imperialibacter]CAD5282707.1 Type IX secretion system membrane protein, PorP/SprF family [Imperialibacter sp. 75]CAD5297543.1 Type IX secretion system membrane protein, PorP/SprF family [Imperialibacter sp. 89]VVT02786.1 Type IX secretion system membrane protein, PorP/SprF family [Imperialibacter sp. EC-SDR9]